MSASHPEQGLFTAAQYAAAYPDGIEHHWWILARSRIVAALLHRHGAIGAPVLEIGCGRGAAVQSLRTLGVDCHGVELAAVDPLPGVSGLVQSGSDALTLPAEFRAAQQTLLLLDVLEHMTQPELFLRELRAAYPAMRRLVLTLPARAELWSNYDSWYGHLRRYDLAALAALAEAAGLTPIEAGYAFHAPYLPAWILARLGLERPVQLRAPGRALRGVHAALARAFEYEWRVLPRGLPGSSVVACLQVRDG